MEFFQIAGLSVVECTVAVVVDDAVAQTQVGLPYSGERVTERLGGGTIYMPIFTEGSGIPTTRSKTSSLV